MSGLNDAFGGHPFELEQIENLLKVDEAKFFETQLQALLKTGIFANEEEKKRAENNLKCLQVYQFQQELRQKVLQNYMTNKVALDFYGQQTLGDILYQRQLVDRNFYRRTKSYTSSKKEARTLDRFEQNMRSGQETRKKNRHREFLNEILQHAKDFHEFHKKRQA